MEERICQLDSEQCPGESCPFWKDEACVIAPLRADLARNACLVTHFVGLRAALARRVPANAVREFHPPGLV